MGDVYWRNGVATELGVSVFTEGDCWILAYRIWQLTGWTVVRVDPIDDEDSISAHHYAVRAPDTHRRLYLDVQGVSTYRELRLRWEAEAIIAAPQERFQQMCQASQRVGYSEFPGSWPRSLTMARRLLDAHGVRA